MSLCQSLWRASARSHANNIINSKYSSFSWREGSVSNIILYTLKSRHIKYSWAWASHVSRRSPLTVQCSSKWQLEMMIEMRQRRVDELNYFRVIFHYNGCPKSPGILWLTFLFANLRIKNLIKSIRAFILLCDARYKYVIYVSHCS